LCGISCFVGGETAEYFRNRKGYFSINVQTVSNANLKILDIVASWPGSSHDTTIFNASALRARFESGVMGDALLVVDGGYDSRSYLMVPLPEPRTQAEELYNESHKRTRNVVERKYGVWKRRFPILSLGMRVTLDHAMAIIVATAVLHNIACLEREDVPPMDPDIELMNINIGEEIPALPANGRRNNANDRVRRNLILNYFSR
jgi:nuclease HARBI1